MVNRPTLNSSKCSYKINKAPEKQSWQLKKKKERKKETQNKQTKMIKNKPKTRIKANQQHKQLGLLAKQSNKLWRSRPKTSVKVIWHNKHWQMKTNKNKNKNKTKNKTKQNKKHFVDG